MVNEGVTLQKVVGCKTKSKCLKGNCSKKFLLQNIFGFHVYITNIYVKLSTETVIMQKDNFEQF